MARACSEMIEDADTLYSAWMDRKQTVHDLDGRPRPVTEMAQTAEVTVGADGLGTNQPAPAGG